MITTIPLPSVSLGSPVCPCCKRQKAVGQPLCAGCLGTLTGPVRRKLMESVGEKYEGAWQEAWVMLLERGRMQ